MQKCDGRNDETPLRSRPKADTIVTSFTDGTGTESVPIFRVLPVWFGRTKADNQVP